jgi:hypothetical protein
MLITGVVRSQRQVGSSNSAGSGQIVGRHDGKEGNGLMAVCCMRKYEMLERGR